jgi:hypothetical protein
MLTQETAVFVRRHTIIKGLMSNRAEGITHIIESHDSGQTPCMATLHENALRGNRLLSPPTLDSPEGEVWGLRRGLARVEVPVQPLGERAEGMNSANVATNVRLVEMGRSLLVHIEALTRIHERRNTPLKPNQREQLHDSHRGFRGAVETSRMAKTSIDASIDSAGMEDDPPELSRHLPLGDPLPQLGLPGQIPHLAKVTTSLIDSLSPPWIARSTRHTGKV